MLHSVRQVEKPYTVSVFIFRILENIYVDINDYVEKNKSIFRILARNHRKFSSYP